MLYIFGTHHHTDQRIRDSTSLFPMIVFVVVCLTDEGMFAWNCFKTKLRDTAVEMLEAREGAEYIVLYILV